MSGHGKSRKSHTVGVGVPGVVGDRYRGAETTITFDGKDVDQGEIYVAVPNINIWEQYNPRDKIVGLALHGTQGTLLEHKGRRCKVRYGDVEGFVKDWFIKELKQDWLKDRLEGRA